MRGFERLDGESGCRPGLRAAVDATPRDGSTGGFPVGPFLKYWN
jgi:hypothetical protein